VRRQLLLCFVLVSSYLIISSVVLCLHAFRVVTEPPHMWRHCIRAVGVFYRQIFLEMWLLHLEK